MHELQVELAALARHLHHRRTAILENWRQAIASDPRLTTGNSLPKAQLTDHIPAVLAGFGKSLGDASLVGMEPVDAANPAAFAGPEAGTPASASAAANAMADVVTAAAHGLHRWQQGYDLREVIRELGCLNVCMVQELEDYAPASADIAPRVMAIARTRWARAWSVGVEESTAQFYRLQQAEAASHVLDLEQAMTALRELDQQRAELWRQVAHDLRGNVGVVSTATHGLGRDGISDPLRDKFLRALERNVAGLHHLLDDVTSLARLNAGSEERNPAECDVGILLRDLCDGLAPLAQQRGLDFRFDGPVPFTVQADASKMRRLAQNLVMNAIKYTHTGEVRVAWGEAGPEDGKRWVLRVEDTGPGLVSGTKASLLTALVDATQLPHQCQADSPAGSDDMPPMPDSTMLPPHRDIDKTGGGARPLHMPQLGGEGIGLSIVKRLCELLDASVELESTPGVGTRFRILLPRDYMPAATSAASAAH